MWITYRKWKNVTLLNFKAENFCEYLHKSILNFFPQDNAINPNNLNMIVKGGESSSQFRWFTIAKIEL